MSAEAAVLVHSWVVGAYRVTLTCQRPQAGQALAASVEWSPGVPGTLSAGEVAQYRAGRDVAIAELARRYGLTAAVLEA